MLSVVSRRLGLQRVRGSMAGSARSIIARHTTISCTSARTAVGPTLTIARNSSSFVSVFGDKQSGESQPKSSGSSAVKPSKSKHFDLFIIGGGSGGLALSREARWLGARVGLADFVDASPAGTSWGLGGTCVNVGCIPKKLFHTASLLGESIHDAQSYGWSLPTGTGTGHKQHDWNQLVSNVKAHVNSTNFVYRVRMQTDGIDYYNAKASFIDRNTLKLTSAGVRGKPGKEEIITATNIAIVVGGRPRALPSTIKGSGAENVITSDDIFFRKTAPGKTLVIGGSYIALETAGFLSGLGYDTTVMNRTETYLRGFDQQMARLVIANMSDPTAHPGGSGGSGSGGHATRFTVGVPLELTRQDNKQIAVRYRAGDSSAAGAGSGEIKTDVFDTVIAAVGRDPYFNGLNLSAANVQCDPNTQKIVVNSQTAASVSTPNVFALGDCVHGGVELTPVAIRAGKLLARRLFAPSSSTASAPAKTTVKTASSSTTALPAPLVPPPVPATIDRPLQMVMDYQSIPTTVFTPIEYSCVGLSEEGAISQFGADRIEVYHTHYQPLEWTAFTDRPGNSGYVKIITLLPEPAAPTSDAPAAPSNAAAGAGAGAGGSGSGSSKAATVSHAQYWRNASRERVLGMHYLGPNAGEVMQGYAVAFRNGMTRADLEETIAIHPTSSEEFLYLNITKRSGQDPKKVGCCG